MLAAQAIGEVLARDERTVRNIVADYERVAKLPETVIAAAEAKGLDLSERKHMRLIEAIKSEIDGNDTPTPPEARRTVGKVFKMSKAHAAKDAPDKADKLRWAVRKRIRTLVNNFPNDQKLGVICLALEEEMYDV